MNIRFTLLADGRSDRILIPLARWTFNQHLSLDTSVDGVFADVGALPQPPRSLSDKIVRAVDLHPCDVLLIHRDAETLDPGLRHEEIRRAFEEARVAPVCRYLCVVPVRMTEAWFLFDEAAIRRAAGNPNGRTSLDHSRGYEGIPDPKSLLLEALRIASGLSGRRLKAFNAGRARARVADLIEDFSTLRGLSAFGRFENDVQETLTQMRSDGVAG